MHIHTLMIECEIDEILFEIDRNSKKKIVKSVLKK